MNCLFTNTSTADAYRNTAIGYGSGVSYTTTICGNVYVGYNVNTGISTHYSTLVGYQAKGGLYSSCLGSDTVANNIYSTAIGYGATTDSDNQIVLGTASETVVAKNNLQVVNGLLTNNLSVIGQTNFLTYLPTYSINNDSFATQPYVQSYVRDYYISTISSYINTRVKSISTGGTTTNNYYTV
jgi:hypothetical protein